MQLNYSGHLMVTKDENDGAWLNCDEIHNSYFHLANKHLLINDAAHDHVYCTRLTNVLLAATSKVLEITQSLFKY